MKITGTLILWSFIGVAFFKWYAKEEAEAKGPAWSEVEEELRELGLSGRQIGELHDRGVVAGPSQATALASHAAV